jgi:hypothetical protein
MTGESFALRRLRTLAVLAGCGILLLGLLWGDSAGLLDVWRGSGSTLQYTDYQAASAFVAARHRPGELVIAALTAPVFLAGVPHDDIRFLPGPSSRTRARRYTRITQDEIYRDFWLGVPSIVTAERLCATMRDHPGSWVIVDETRLRSNSFFGGAMQDAIDAGSEVVFTGGKRVQVRRILAASDWQMPVPEDCSSPAES